jgi:hypothetical protein
MIRVSILKDGKWLGDVEIYRRVARAADFKCVDGDVDLSEREAGDIWTAIKVQIPGVAVGTFRRGEEEFEWR